MAQALLWVASKPLVGALSVLTDIVKSEVCIKSRAFVTPDTPALPEAEIDSNGGFTVINEHSATITLCNVKHALSMTYANEWAIEFTDHLLKISALTMVYRNQVNHSFAYSVFFGYTIAVINFTGKAFTTESPTSPRPRAGAPPDPPTSLLTRKRCREPPTSPTPEPSAGAPPTSPTPEPNAGAPPTSPTPAPPTAPTPEPSAGAPPTPEPPTPTPPTPEPPEHAAVRKPALDVAIAAYKSAERAALAAEAVAVAAADIAEAAASAGTVAAPEAARIATATSAMACEAAGMAAVAAEACALLAESSEDEPRPSAN